MLNASLNVDGILTRENDYAQKIEGNAESHVKDIFS